MRTPEVFKKTRAEQIKEGNKKRGKEFKKKPAPFSYVSKEERATDYFRWQRRTQNFQIPRLI